MAQGKSSKTVNRTKNIHNLFYLPKNQLIGDKITIKGDELHYIRNVLRKKTGDIIYITDGIGNRYEAQIIEARGAKLIAQILNYGHHPEKNRIDLNLAFALLKGLRNDYVIEKGTELGIRNFIIFISKFCVASKLSTKKLIRFTKIARSAMLQSRRYYHPEIIFKPGLNEIINEFEKYDLILIADKKGKREIPKGKKKILFIVGPEGGFDQTEIEILSKHKAYLMSLGEKRLRSETAAITGISKILTVYGRI